MVRYGARPVEGIAWDGRALALVAEGGGFYRLSEKTWRAAVAQSKPAAPALSRGQLRGEAGQVLESK